MRIPIGIALVSILSVCQGQSDDLELLRVPPGFTVSVYAELENPRQLALSDEGVVFVGSIRDKVSALIDSDGDNRADQVITVADDLYAPNGVTIHDGDLYIGEVNRISKIENIDAVLSNLPDPVTVNDELSDDRHHGLKYIAVGPDGKLYLQVGAPCNVCEVDGLDGTIVTMNLDGSELAPIAYGVRSSVGLDWHPQSGELWFTDNGRDMLGDDIPACEINRLTQQGQHFGFPYIHQGDLPDPEFGVGRDPADFTPPVLKLIAHSAPLGITFYRGSSFPGDYANSVFWAEHGSWNRSEKSGYRVMVGILSEDNTRIVEQRPFVTGWLQGQQHWGRPADILNMPDGSVLISDDMADRVLRISYD